MPCAHDGAVSSYPFSHRDRSANIGLVPAERAAQHPLVDGLDRRIFPYGNSKFTEGVLGRSIILDGESLLKVTSRPEMSQDEASFTLSVWGNPYRLHRQQQMIAAKNRYSLGEREWGVMIDKDNRFRLYVWQGKICLAITEMRWSHNRLSVQLDSVVIP